MEELTEAGLVQFARQYYPTGFPVEKDEYLPDGRLPYQHTPEYARSQAAWAKALAWPEWKELLRQMHGPFGNNYADCTQPWGGACRRCCVYIKHPLPNGARLVTRVAAAVSILAPLYVTYWTKAIVANGEQRILQFSFEPTEEVREPTTQLAAMVERVLGYQRFPLHFANIPVPGIRVDIHADREPTLLDAFFDDRLENLP